MRGRPPKPTEIKKLEGNLGKRPLNEFEPRPAKCIPNPPEYLDEFATQAWNIVSETLDSVNVLTVADRDMLALYCTLHSQWRQCQEIIKKEGMTMDILNTDGSIKYSQQRPEVGIANKCSQQMISLAGQFGMTPAARTKLMVLPGRDNGDSFEDLLA